MEKLKFKEHLETLNYLLKEEFDEKKVHAPEEAFMKLIRGAGYENLTNLCSIMKENYEIFVDEDILTEEHYYVLTQCCNDKRKEILELAYKCLERGLTLGTKTINEGKINTSSWYSHSLYVAEACANLAKWIGLNENVARTLGLLHDFGRKYNHSFNHVTIGADYLVLENWKEEAIACLTHSFVNGGRCANNEPAVLGFYVDEFGNAMWEESAEKDDVAYFLENYNYTDYDRILNIADLIATDKGIVSPYDRIKDIATRRTIDLTNRGYFLSEFNNLLIDFLKKGNCYQEELQYIKATKDTTLEQIEENFLLTSHIFFNEYYKYVNGTIKNDVAIQQEQTGPKLVKKYN